jgi:hypothetical protein
MGVLGTAPATAQKARPARAKGLLEANRCSEPTGQSAQNMPVKRGWYLDRSARAPVNDLRASRASQASAAPARLGPQKNWPRPAIMAAAATTWAILMIRLTVTHFILARAYPPGIGT